jgi:SMI1 / KNR4 family (SUKH-1)
MPLKLTEQNESTSDERISQFEAVAEISLPQPYRSFLLDANGGRPNRSLFPIEGLENNPFGSVHFFFGLDDKLESDDLEKMFVWFASSIPIGVVCIARTDCADYICLDLRDGKEAVVFWDHRHFWGAGEWREEDLYPVATSFDEFLGLLRSDRA